jgi:hypothetical protein
MIMGHSIGWSMPDRKEYDGATVYPCTVAALIHELPKTQPVHGELQSGMELPCHDLAHADHGEGPGPLEGHARGHRGKPSLVHHTEDDDCPRTEAEAGGRSARGTLKHRLFVSHANWVRNAATAEGLLRHRKECRTSVEKSKH